MATSGLYLKKKDLQKIAQAIQEFQAKILCDVDAAKLRDALNLTLLQMQTYWKILKKKQDRRADKYTWPWYDLRNPEKNAPHYLASSLYGAGVQKVELPPLFDLLSSGSVEQCEAYIATQGYKGEIDVLGRTPLHYCAGVTNLENHTKFFVQHGCDINHQAHDGSTALHRAVINENAIVAEDLLKCNVDTRLRDSEGRTASHWAVTAQDTACLELLVAYKADINTADNECETPIIWSVMQGNMTSLKVLLSSPFGPKLARTTDNKGQTLLHMGVNHSDIVNLLLNSETVHEKDKYDRNILHHAAINGALDICKMLEEKFDLLALLTSDSDGRTPVHYAVNNAHSSVTNFLLEHGGSTTSKDMQGLSPHSIAELKQLHYCSIVISAYHQGDEPKQSVRPTSNIVRGDHVPLPSAPPGPLPTGCPRAAPPGPLPTASLDQHPNERRVLIRNISVTKSSGGLSKSSPALRLQHPPSLSTITPGLLRHSVHQPVSQKPSRLRELTDIRDKITGRVEQAPIFPPRAEQAPIFPPRPSSSRGKRNNRPSSPTPNNTIEHIRKEEVTLPWKLNNIPPKPPPPKHQGLSNGEIFEPEARDIPDRPKTARGNNIDSEDLLHREDSGILQCEEARMLREDVRISPRYGKVDPIPCRKIDTVEQTLEIVHTLPDNKPLIKGSAVRSSAGSLLGPMPVLPGRQQQSSGHSNTDPNPWYKKKLIPVSPNKMDILQPENPPDDD